MVSKFRRLLQTESQNFFFQKAAHALGYLILNILYCVQLSKLLLLRLISFTFCMFEFSMTFTYWTNNAFKMSLRD